MNKKMIVKPFDSIKLSSILADLRRIYDGQHRLRSVIQSTEETIQCHLTIYNVRTLPCGTRIALRLTPNNHTSGS